MKKFLPVVMGMAVIIWALPGLSEEGKVYDRARIKLTYWTAAYSGNMKIKEEDVYGGTTTLIGEDIDLEDEFGIINPRGIPEIEAEIRLGKRHRIIVGFFGVIYSGEKISNTNVDIAGYTFLANTKLKTEFKTERYKLMYEYRPIQKDNMSLGIVAGVEYFHLVIDYQGTANQQGVGVTVKDSNELPAPIPVAGFRARINNEYGLGIYCDLAGMAASYEEIEASYFDLDTGIYYDHDRLYASLGYRLLDTRLDAELENDEEISSHSATQGWLVSVGMNF